MLNGAGFVAAHAVRVEQKPPLVNCMLNVTVLHVPCFYQDHWICLMTTPPLHGFLLTIVIITTPWKPSAPIVGGGREHRTL